jgi:hypothetical protein
MILVNGGHGGEYCLIAKCDCSAISHVIELYYAAGDSEFFVSAAMDPTELSWWKRARVAVRYVFRPRSICRFGGGPSVLLRPEDAKDIIAWLVLRIAQMEKGSAP